MKVLITDKLDPAAAALLESRGLIVEQVSNKNTQDVERALQSAKGWVVRSGTQVTKELMAHAKDLLVIGRAGVGVDNIDVAEATRRGIAVVNTPSGNTVAAVEHTVAMLLSLARNIPQAHASLVINKQWERSAFTGVELYGKNIGIIGLGKIGSRVASRCRALEMNVLAFDPYLSEERAVALDVEYCDDLDAMLLHCDFLTLHMPGTAETKHLLNADRIAKLKPGVRVVNCARGTLIDEQALADALASGQIAGAAIDVFAEEPPFDSPLINAPNLVATPHLGASTEESQRNVGVQVAEQVADAVLNGVFKDAVNIPVRDWATFEKLTPQLNLLERLGMLAQQYAATGITQINVEYAGGSFEEISALNNTLLKGVLSPVLGASVNAVNASLLAQERGIRLTHTQRKESTGYNNLISVRVTTTTGEHNFAATTFSDQLPRLVQLDGREVDVYLGSTLLIFSNVDRPGVIGNVGNVLGQNNINIAHFSLGRQIAGGEALAIVAVDDDVSEEVMRQLRELNNMSWVKRVSLGAL